MQADDLIRLHDVEPKAAGVMRASLRAACLSAQSARHLDYLLTEAICTLHKWLSGQHCRSRTLMSNFVSVSALRLPTRSFGCLAPGAAPKPRIAVAAAPHPPAAGAHVPEMPPHRLSRLAHSLPQRPFHQAGLPFQLLDRLTARFSDSDCFCAFLAFYYMRGGSISCSFTPVSLFLPDSFSLIPHPLQAQRPLPEPLPSPGPE